MLGGGTGRAGAAEPLDSPERTLKGTARSGGHPSGGEKTTMTRRSSLMWWNLCGTPAGT